MQQENQLPVIVPLTPKLVLPTMTQELTPVQKGWLQMCLIRDNVFAGMQLQELAIQKELNNIQALTNLQDVQVRIKTAKAYASESKGQRLFFTNMLKEKIIDKAMEHEKRNDVLIAAADIHEFNCRKESVATQSKAEAHAREVAALKAHITNEHFRIAAEYRLALNNLITEGYETALKQKIKTRDIDAFKESIAGFLQQVTLGKFIRFERVSVTDAQAKEIFASVPPYVTESDFKYALRDLEKQFEMYDEDSKNATAAIAQATKKQQEVVAETARAIEIETATNSLIASADQFVLTGGATIKTKLEIEVVNSDEWALAVITAMLKHWHAVRSSLRVTSWSKLTMLQIAAALGKIATENPGTTYTGLKLNKIEK